MKKIALLLVVAAVVVSSCKKKDSGKPQIYFKVSNPDTAIVGEQYEIPTPSNHKVEADDNIDGREVEKNLTYIHNIPVRQAAGNMIIPDRIGRYYIKYTVRDEAGNDTSKNLNIVVYNEAYPYATWYRVTKSSNESISPDYVDYQNVFIKLEQDSFVNMRLIFPKLSNIEGLAVYGDLVQGDNDTTLLVNIPSQEVPVVERDSAGDTLGVFLYVIRNVEAGSSYFMDMNHYKIRLHYDINKYSKVNNLQDADYTTQSVPDYGMYWKHEAQDQCVETYTKM